MNHRFGVRMLALWVSVLLFGGCKGATQSKDELLQKGQIYENLKQHTEAIAQYDAALKQDPFFKEAYLRKGTCHKELGNYREALSAFQKGFVLDTAAAPFIHAIAEVQFLLQEFETSLETLKKLPNEGKDDPFALNLTGKITAVRGDMAEAEKYLRRAVEVKPDDPKLARDLTVLLISKKETEKALKAAREFLKGKNPGEHFEMSLIYFDLLLALRQEEDALAFIQTLDQKKPKNPDVLFRYGQYYFAKEDLDASMKYADQALALFPTHLDSQMLKGTLYLRQGKGKEGLLLWQALAKNFPNVPDVQFKLAVAYELDGQYEQAKTAYQRLAQMAPDFVPGQLALARIYFRDGWHNEIKKITDRILEKNPDNTEALKIRAASLLAQRNFDEAIPIYQQILTLEPELEKNHALLAELYLANGNFSGALQESREALKQDPNDLRMMLVAALALRFQGVTAQAVELLQQILKKDPSYLQARFNLGELYASQKLWAPAEEQYQAVLEKQPENLPALLNLGKLYFMRGETEKAETYFLELLKKYPEEGELSFELGRLYANQKRIPEAIEKFKAVVGKNPKHVLGNLLLANLYRQNGDLDEAEGVLRVLVKENAALHLDNDLALLLIAQGKPQDAISLIKGLTVVEQQRPPLLLTRGLANLLLGQGEEALVYLRRVEDQNGSNLVYALALAQAYSLLGNEEKGREMLLSRGGDFPELDRWYRQWTDTLKKREPTRGELLEVFHRYLIFSYYQWVAQAQKEAAALRESVSPLPLFAAIDIRLLQETQDWDAALRLADELLASEPQSAYAHFVRAQILWRKGEQNSAFQAYAEALKIGPDSVWVRVSLARVLTEQRRFAEAEALCRDTIERKPGSAEPYFILYNILLQQGRLDEAAVFMKRLSERNPEDVRSSFLLATLYFNLRRFSDAADILKNIFVKDPKNADANLLYLKTLMALDRYQDAEAVLINIRQNMPRVNVNIPQIVIYLKQGRIQEAMSAAFRVTPSELNAPLSLYVLGLLYQATGDFEKSLRYFSMGAEKVRDNLLYNLAYVNVARKELSADAFQKELEARLGKGEGTADYVAMVEDILNNKQNPAAELFQLNMLYHSILNMWDEDAYAALSDRLREYPKNLFFYRMAFFICDRNRWADKEIDLLKKQLEHYPNDEFAMMQLARLKLSQNAPEEALGYFKKVLKIHPENEEALVFSGMILGQKEDHAAARAQYEKALELNPKNVVALNNLSYHYSTHSPVDLNKAAELGERALAIAPESGPVADTLGWIYFQQGRYAEALVQLKRARQMIPNVAEVRYHLGKTYLQLQDSENARLELSEAIKLDPKAPFAGEVNGLLETIK